MNAQDLKIQQEAPNLEAVQDGYPETLFPNRGTAIEQAAVDTARRANEIEDIVTLIFNKVILPVHPNTNPAAVVTRYFRAAQALLPKAA